MIGIERAIAALGAISAHPTAPFYEYRMARYILSELERMGLPVRRDQYGNIIAEYAGVGAPEKGIAVVAHMDHPGFELANEEGTQGWLLGGVKKECLDKGVPVRVYPGMPGDGPEDGVAGKVTGAEKLADGRTRLSIELDGVPPKLPAFGMWGFAPVEMKDDIAHMRAIDDVVGCATILLMLEQLVERQVPCRCYGVFTRAEELDFYGAIPFAREKVLPPDTIVVSLETSKTLPGAEIGGGPVIRVGDRTTTFDRKAEMVLLAGTEAMKKDDPDAKVQRQLMSGGMCEGTVFALEGYCTTAMAIPLGNYHNMTPELTLAPEYVSVHDMAGAVELLVRSMEFVDADNSAADRKRIHDRAEPHLGRLKSTYEEWCSLDCR